VGFPAAGGEKRLDQGRYAGWLALAAFNTTSAIVQAKRITLQSL
jgi:hypothetical protein